MQNIIENFEKQHRKETGILILSNEIIPKIIYADTSFKKLHGFSDKLGIEGLQHSELPHQVSEYAEELVKTTHIVVNGGKKIASLTKHPDSLIYGDVIPLRGAFGDVVAVGVTLTKTKIFSPRNLFLKQAPAHLVFQAPSELLTEKQWEVLYLLIMGFLRKEIAKILQINLNAISYLIEGAFQKTGTSSTTQLVEYAISHRWDSYLPSYFLKFGHIRLG